MRLAKGSRKALAYIYDEGWRVGEVDEVGLHYSPHWRSVSVLVNRYLICTVAGPNVFADRVYALTRTGRYVLLRQHRQTIDQLEALVRQGSRQLGVKGKVACARYLAEIKRLEGLCSSLIAEGVAKP